MKNNKFFTAIIAAIIAFCGWIYVVTVITPDYETTVYNIPLGVEGEALLEDKGLILMTRELPKVTLRLYGNRSDLNKLDNSNITLKIDLSKVYEAGVHSLPFSVSYPGNIASGDIQIQQRLPGSRISIEVENLLRKEVPVVVNYIGEPAQGYICDRENALLEYEKVSLSGPESVISQITKARLDVNLTDRSESFSESYRYTLCDANDQPVEAGMVTTNVADVDFTLMIYRLKEIPLVLDIAEGGGATRETAKITVFPQTIQVIGSEDALADLNELVLGRVDLAKTLEAQNYSVELILPPGVQCYNGETHATVDISFPDLMTRFFHIQNFELMNVAEGLEAKTVTRSVEVALRGPKDLIAALTTSDILIRVDLTGQGQGTVSKEAVVVLPQGHEQTGVLNPVSVVVELQVPAVEVVENEVVENDPTGPNP